MLLSRRGNRTRNATPSTMRWSGIILVLYVCLGLVDYAESESEPPKFMKTIANFTAAAGDAEIKLTCQVRASKKTQYWWTKDGQNIDTTTRRFKYKHFRYLKIKKVKFSDAGEYTCMARNEAGEIQHKMRLYVIAPKPTSHLPEGKPFFTRPHKMDKEVLVYPAANLVNMVCDANGNPNPTVTWYKDGKIFTKRKDETYPITPHTFTLSIKSAILADSGIYKCNVSNKYGYINKTYKLDVQELYVSIPVMEMINNVTAYVGDNVTVLCKAFSDGLPHFQLLVYNKVTKNLAVLKPKLQNNRYLLPFEEKRHGVRLFFPNVSLEDSKEYTCMAGNYLGHDYMSFYINVLAKRPMTTEPTVNSQEPKIEEREEIKQSSSKFIIILIVLCIVTVLVFASIAAYLVYHRMRTKGRAVYDYRNVAQHPKNRLQNEYVDLNQYKI